MNKPENGLYAVGIQTWDSAPTLILCNHHAGYERYKKIPFEFLEHTHSPCMECGGGSKERDEALTEVFLNELREKKPKTFSDLMDMGSKYDLLWEIPVRALLRWKWEK